tara:strand:- start:360 stop:662 length:303 start_codon:yes stop_codon:yes gene_type:complete
MKKNERIIGLVIGLIGMVVLFHFNFEIGFRLNGADYSIIAYITYDIISFLNDGSMGSAERDIADYLFWFIYLIYLLFIWFYRACIGHWAIKIVTLGYKKI